MASIRLKLISCEVFRRETTAIIARSPNHVDVEFFSKGLHEIPCALMLARLQSALDGVRPETYDAVALGYGFCNHGLAGLTARALPVAIPRAHDCLTLLLGSRERYLQEFERNPGTYYRSSGWLENRTNPNDIDALSIARKNGLNSSFEELVERYGEDNARYLVEQLGGAEHSYSRLAYIETGIEPDDRFERETREDAARRGWNFEKLQGDITLLQRLVDGDWKDDFLVLQPGQQIEPTYDNDLIRSVSPCKISESAPCQSNNRSETNSP